MKKKQVTFLFTLSTLYDETDEEKSVITNASRYETGITLILR